MIAKLYTTVLEFVWGFLPDKCEVPSCSRRGVRGNENRVDGRLVCDYCFGKMPQRRSA